MTITFPQPGCTLTLKEDWQVELDWRDRNLRMLKAFNLTGMAEDQGRRWVWKKGTDGNPNEYVQQFTRKTVRNKLFMDDEGNYVPVLITFPEGTTFIISRFNQGQVNGCRYAVRSVDLKCSGSSKKGIKNLLIQIDYDQFDGMPATVEWPDPKVEDDGL